MNDSHFAGFAGLILSCFLIVACGGERRSEAPPAAPEPAATEAPAPEEKTAAPPAAAPASPAAGAAEEIEAEGAPASTRDEAQETSAQPPAPRSTKNDQDKKKSLAKHQSDLDALTARLDGVVALSTPDCPTAWALRDQICDLSRRLCDVATKNGESDVAERCADGKARCDRATAKVRAVCSK